MHCIQLPAFSTTAWWQQWQAARATPPQHSHPGTTRASPRVQGERPATQQKGVCRHKNRQRDVLSGTPLPTACQLCAWLTHP